MAYETGLARAEPSLSNHCECGFPMVVLIDAGGYWRDGSHNPDREAEAGLSVALDAHHRALLCSKCDGTDAFDVEHHYGLTR